MAKNLYGFEVRLAGDDRQPLGFSNRPADSEREAWKGLLADPRFQKFHKDSLKKGAKVTLKWWRPKTNYEIQSDHNKVPWFGTRGGVGGKFCCPCCGYLVFNECGNYSICPICFWEDCSAQAFNYDDASGPNHTSLRNSQKNYMKFGATNKYILRHCRKPGPEDRRDPKWSPIPKNFPRFRTMKRRKPELVENPFA